MTRGPTVEPEGVLIQVVVEMFTADSALMSTQQPALEERGHPVNTRPHRIRRFSAAEKNPAIVHAAKAGKGAIALQPVRDQ